MLKRHDEEEGAGIATLSLQLASIKPAANLQASRGVTGMSQDSTDPRIHRQRGEN